MTSKDIHLDIYGDQNEVAVIRLTRPKKRNAINDALILSIRDLFEKLPATVHAAVIDGEGEHFCAGLDLSELSERDAGQGLIHSRMWHAALERVQYGPVPGVAARHGAVVGGGRELARACQIAEVIFIPEDIGQNRELAIIFKDQPHRHAGNRRRERNTRIHHRQRTTTDRSHRG